MVCRVSHTTFDCRDAFELSEWWKRVLGYVNVTGDPNEAGDEECVIVDPKAATAYSSSKSTSWRPPAVASTSISCPPIGGETMRSIA